MYKPDKATTERNAKILRELVKQPDNKLCADCKRNDPRWASWNLGVYLCIRCSGIHRGMGTHISRVKSIDLDMWTPEQMESIQKWGNRRANLYWEAHLKAGHVPPDHKMESYIRSKYETKRWAMEGPPPADPTILDDHANANAHTAPTTADPTPLLDTRTSTATSLFSAPRAASPSLHTPSTYRHTAASRQLLSAAVAGRVHVSSAPSPSQPQAPSQQPRQQQQQQDDLFSLDFHAPATAVPQAPVKDVKQDILSLFSAGSAPQVQPVNVVGQGATQSPQAISMMGTTRTGMWGVSSGWTGAPQATPSSTNIWGTASTGTNAFGVVNTNDIWGGSTTQPVPAPKKDDVFGDLWGDFK